MLLRPSYSKVWTPPAELPRLTDAKVISFDTETYDPNLLTRGPGWATNDGYVVGVSVATKDRAWYIPIRNDFGQGCPYGEDNVTQWLKDSLGTNIPKVGANLTYDVGWLSTMGVDVKGQLFDVQFAESLLSDTARTNLDALGMKYANEGKTSNDLYDWCSLTYGKDPGPGQRANIYRAPMELVGPYAESDASLPLEVMSKQWKLLHEQDLMRVYDMECRLIPMMVAMRKQGVRVDVERAEELYEKLTIEAEILLHDLGKQAGRDISVNSNDDLGFLADKLNIRYPRTPVSKKPQFQKKWLEEHSHPVMAQILEARGLLKLTGTFLKSYIMDSHVNGKIHGEFHQLRADEGGAKTGRFSSSHPNMQNIPIRTALGKMLRSLFIPFEGDTHWMKADYSQIEYRFLAHYATGPGAHDVRAAYLHDPNTDYHSMIQSMVLAITGLEIPRGPIKNINFGLIYGMGMKKLATQLGVDFITAQSMSKAYHKGAPYVNATMKAVMAEAQENGFITTILGRRTRFDMWVPVKDKFKKPLPFAAAVRQYGGNIERAFLYKALNYKLQGSAADEMKLAMVNCWEAGVFERFRLPALTVHDELDISYNAPDTDPAVFVELKAHMERAIELAVPVITDFEVGPSWGEVTEVSV